jgi:SAM-dependent methyltransferase
MGKKARLKIEHVAEVAAAPLKLDFGCGPHKREGFKGVDAISFVGVDSVLNVVEQYDPERHGFDGPRTPAGYRIWPWPDNSVIEANASHFIEHLTALERVHFMNELYRVLIPGGKFQMAVPHWCSNRAYGDPTHQWPPVAEMWFYYLSKAWRKEQAPHTDISVNRQGFDCDFEATWGYAMRGDLTTRNAEFQQNALANYKEAAQDLIANLTKRVVA